MKKLDITVYKNGDLGYLIYATGRKGRKLDLELDVKTEYEMYDTLQRLSKRFIITLEFRMNAEQNYGFLSTRYWLNKNKEGIISYGYPRKQDEDK